MLGINEKANQCLQSLLCLPYGFIAKIFLLVSIVQSIIACSGLEVMSMEVKSGGTVMVAVSRAVDEQTPVMSELTAMLTDANSLTQEVTVRYVMRVLPDPLSKHGISNDGGVQSLQYKSQIFAIVDILPPGSSSPPTNIASGDAILEISNALTNQITLHEIVILSGTAFKNPLTTIDYESNSGSATGGWGYALPNPNVLINTLMGSFDPASATITGATFTLNYITADFQATSEFFAVVKTTNDPNLQLSWNYTDIGDGTSQLSITLANPHGFYSPSDNVVHKDLKSVFRHLSSVAIVWIPYSYTGSAEYPFTGLQATYFDTNGNVVNGLTTLPERRH